MVDITHKNRSLRIAIATATVSVSRQETIDAILAHTVPKGDVFEVSRVAGLFAVKKTSELIPDCHPLPIEYTRISHEIKGLDICIEIEVKTIYKTGVEVEAMHGASVVALTIYDMLKPIDKGIEIKNIQLKSKRGGKSDRSIQITTSIKTGIIICSDSVSKGISTDLSGPVAKEKFEHLGLHIQSYQVIADDFTTIQSVAKELSKDHDLLFFIGGTGLSPRDVTPDALQPLIEREVPGIPETIRQYGQERMPYAMLSRGVAGFIDNALVITSPGSPAATRETIDAIFPAVLHIFKIKEGAKH